jgi:F0F1-type ATP synthase epsilon subunit
MTEPKELLLIIEQLRRSNRRWKALALAACAVLVLMAGFSVVAATRARIQAEHAMRAEQVARQNAELARLQAQRAANPGQPR